MLHRTTDMALKNLGYGADKNPTVNNLGPTVVNVAVSVADLEAAREALRRNQQAHPTPPPLIDADGDAARHPRSWRGRETIVRRVLRLEEGSASPREGGVMFDPSTFLVRPPLPPIANSRLLAGTSCPRPSRTDIPTCDGAIEQPPLPRRGRAE